MRNFSILCISLVLLTAAFAEDGDVDHYKEGQRLFGERNFAAALAEFEEVDRLVPNESKVYSWIGACLNELGRHAEAKGRLEAAFALLREEQRVAVEKKKPAPVIDVGYYTLLAGIQVNLREYQDALKTIESYPLKDDASERTARAKQALDGARAILKTKLVSVGTECLRAGDVECARTTFTQASLLAPSSPSLLETIARESLSRAEKAPGTTDEDKAKKAELHRTAVAASRLWLDEAGPDSTQAQLVLAQALSGTKKEEGYEEAIRILTSLWEGSPDPASRDNEIQLALAVAHGGLEQWDLMVASASTFIQLAPNDPLGQGHCLRSFAQFQLGRCDEAVDDASNCKNADGSVRPLKHVDMCKQRTARVEADKAAARRAKIERQCDHLHERLEWASRSLSGISIEDLVGVIADFAASEAECRSYLEAVEKKKGNGFTSPTPALCAAGVDSASSPFNLSSRSKEELELLRTNVKKFSTLCRSSLAPSQTSAVEGGLVKIERALEKHR